MGHETTENEDGRRSIEESHGGSLAVNDTISPRDSLLSGVSEQSQTATAADDVENHRYDEESPKELVENAENKASPEQPVKAAEEVVSATATTQTKPDQTSSKPGNNRTKNVSKNSDKKVWKPAGSTQQQNRKELGMSGTSGRGGKPQRQGNGSVPTRLPPISVSGVGNSDRRRQQGTEAARGGGNNGLAVGRSGAGIGELPGRLYKCSATACVTVLSQPPVTTDWASANGDEPSSWSTDLSNRNRKYVSISLQYLNASVMRLPHKRRYIKSLTFYLLTEPRVVVAS